MDLQTQIPLVLEKQTKAGSRFEIHHEGLQFLRNFSAKKLRVIFNLFVNTSANTSMILFQQVFMTGIIPPLFQHLSFKLPDNLVSVLTISKNIQILSHDQLLIMLNAHQSTPVCSYLLLGYLVSSIIIYHNLGQINQKSPLIQILSEFYGTLKASNIKELTNLGNPKSPSSLSASSIGFEKKPYFICMMHMNSIGKQSPANAKQTFLGLFKNIDGNSTKQLKRSTDVILQHLSNRTAFYLSDRDPQAFAKDCLKIKNSLLNSPLVKRKILEYQISGSTVENLCLQLFQLLQLNNQSQSPTQQLDLLTICSQVISNQKQKIFTEGIDFYLRRLDSTIHYSEMPYDPEQLWQYHSMVVKQAFDYINEMSISCMTLEQYISIRKDIESKIEQTFLDLEIKNGKSSQEYNRSLKESLSELQLEELELVVDEIKSRIDNYVYRCKGVEAKDNLGELAKDLVERYFEIEKRRMEELETNGLDLEVEGYRLKLKVQRLEDQNREIMRRYEGLIQQKELEMMNRIKQSVFPTDPNPIPMTVSSNNQQILKLKQQIFDQQVQIQDLTQKLSTYDFRFNKQKQKPKSQFSTLTKQFSLHLKQFDKIYQNMQKVDDIVRSSKKQIQKEKMSIIKDRDAWMLEKQQIMLKNQVLIFSEKGYLENINRVNETVELYKEIVEYMKNNLEVHAHQLITQKIAIAELETNALIYHKCIQLIWEGRNNPGGQLQKFLNSIENQEIKQYVLEVIRK